MIYENKSFIFIAFQIMMQNLEYFNNSKKITIVDLVSNFCQNLFFKKKSYYMSLAQIDFCDYFIRASFKN